MVHTIRVTRENLKEVVSKLEKHNQIATYCPVNHSVFIDIDNKEIEIVPKDVILLKEDGTVEVLSERGYELYLERENNID